MRRKLKLLIVMAVAAILVGCSIDEPSVNAGDFPFVKEGKTWICGITTYEMIGDTIIRGKSYKKLYKQNVDYYGDNNKHYFAAVREKDKQVYAIKAKQRKEILLYDFSLEVGEFFTVKETEKYIIEYKVSEITHLIDTKRTKWYMFYFLNHQIYTTGFEYWIEGIGDLRSPFYSIEDTSVGSLYTCYEDDICIYPCNLVDE